MTALVTGAAGFIGSHLAAALVAAGERVRGVDLFTDYYARERKERNVAPLLRSAAFELVEVDLIDADLAPLLRDVDVVYHLAGQPGVRPSWGRDFSIYARHNVLATQSLLEAIRRRPVRKVVYASSSSVYGNAEAYPTSEAVRPQPLSPYGVTKLAAEHLCELYRTNFGVPTVSLRLFTAYGPRQRPDMAFSRLIRSALEGGTFELFGDGNQTRDFTYVTDVVRAFRDAARSEWVGVANVGGGSRVSMNHVLAILEELGARIDVRRGPPQAGDVTHTAADISIAAGAFGYAPTTSVRDGLASMLSSARSEVVLA